ncbi:MAG TPA: glycosyltransferase family 1 protein [Rhodothermales bacterium]|nr:glycosyltransferase family 1 protein [Rhodothermales bacterium]
MSTSTDVFDLRRAVGRTSPAPIERRIALFTGNYNHIADGVSLTLNRLVGFLERIGAKVLVFGPTIDDPAMAHEGTFIPVPSVAAPGRHEYRISLRLPRGARKTLAEFQPNLFHIATPDFVGRSALLMAKKWDIPVVASYHTHFSSYLKYYGFEEFEGLLWKYLRRFYRQCEHVYVPSYSMEAVLRAHEINRGLKLWERGVDTKRFNPANRIMEWREAHGIRGHEVIITLVSRLVWEKALHLYASVIRSLEERGIPHRSVVVGEGPAKAELMARLPNTIFKGYLSGAELTHAYASSDVFLFPSDTETFGNVTLEAMASGVPAVCADATGSQGLVLHGETGFLAPSGNERAFFEYTKLLATDPLLRAKMSVEARRRSLHYEWDATLRRLVGYYDEILNPAAQPSFNLAEKGVIYAPVAG